MTPERIQEYKDSIDSALALLMDFRKALDRPQIVSSRCAYCDETFGEVESGECPPALLEHAKTCSKSPPANEIRRLKKLVKSAFREGILGLTNEEAKQVWDNSKSRKALESP